MACVNEKRLVCEKALLLRVLRQIFCKRKRFVLRKRRLFLFMQGHLEKKSFCLRKKLVFSAHAKPTDKGKLFFSTPRQQFPTAPKLTCNNPFRIALATVSLQKDNSFSKLRNLASDVWLPFRTDSNPHRRYPERLQFPAQPVT